MLYHPDPNKPWIIEMDSSKTAFMGVLLQPHILDRTMQEVPVTLISYSFTGTQQSWSVTERELYTIHASVRKIHYMINGGKIIIRMDHKPLIDIAAGTAKVQNSAASEKLCRWTYDLIALGPEIEYKKGSANMITDSLSRLRTDEHYTHDKPLKNTEPIYLEDKAELNIVQTRAKTAEQENSTERLPELQVRVKDILKVSDKRQLIRNADDILKSLDPGKL